MLGQSITTLPIRGPSFQAELRKPRCPSEQSHIPVVPPDSGDTLSPSVGFCRRTIIDTTQNIPRTTPLSGATFPRGELSTPGSSGNLPRGNSHPCRGAAGAFSISFHPVIHPLAPGRPSTDGAN